MGPRLAVAAAALAAAAVAACGTPSPDLFVVTRTGVGPAADLKLLVSDTSIRCNDGKRIDLTSKQILDAREISDDLIETQRDDDRPPIPQRGTIFTFSVRNEEGTLRFADTARRPDVLARLVRFTRTVAQDLCGLKR